MLREVEMPAPASPKTRDKMDRSEQQHLKSRTRTNTTRSLDEQPAPKRQATAGSKDHLRFDADVPADKNQRKLYEVGIGSKQLEVRLDSNAFKEFMDRQTSTVAKVQPKRKASKAQGTSELATTLSSSEDSEVEVEVVQKKQPARKGNAAKSSQDLVEKVSKIFGKSIIACNWQQ
jgi:hypothetical protein